MKKVLLIKLKIILSLILVSASFKPLTGFGQTCPTAPPLITQGNPCSTVTIGVLSCAIGNQNFCMKDTVCLTVQISGGADSAFYEPELNVRHTIQVPFNGIIKYKYNLDPDSCYASGSCLAFFNVGAWGQMCVNGQSVGYGIIAAIPYPITLTPNARPEFDPFPNDSLCIIDQPFTFNLRCIYPATSYLWNFGDTNTSADTASGVNPSYTYSQTGTYTVTCTASNQCSTSTYQTVVTVGPVPVPVINPNPVAVCPGTTATLTASGGSSYLWNTSATTQSITVSASTYTVTVTNNFYCSASTSIAITTKPAPIAGITGSNTFCQGGSTTLYSSNVYPVYLWTGGSTANSIVVSSSGTYTLTVTGTNGCTASASKYVSQSNNLNVTIAAQPPSVCSGNQTTVTANSGGGWTYAWSNGPTTQNFTTAMPGTYTVTVSDGICTGTASITIQSHPNPLDSISGNDTICTGQNTTFYLTGSYTGYQWSGGSTSPTISVSQAGIYTVTITDANGCTATASVQLVVNPPPNAVITASPPSASACQGNNVTLTAGPPGMTYSWSNTATTASITAGTNANFTVTVTDPATGCDNSATQQVTINPLPVPVITGTMSVCDGNPAILYTTNSYSTYSWSGGQTGPTFSTMIAGIYTVTVTDPNGCTGSASATVTVSTNPGLSITVTDPVICQGSSTLITSTVSNCSGCIYQWSDGTSASSTYAFTQGYYTLTVTNSDGCSHDSSVFVTVNPSPLPAINGTSPLCQGTGTTLDAGVFLSYSWGTGATTQTIYVTTSNTYTITVTDANGCTGTDNITITVNPLPVPAIAGNTTFCQGSATILDAGLYSSWLWSSGATGQTISVNAAGTYTVTVSDVNGCIGEDSVSIIVNLLPVAAIVTNDSTLCQGESTLLDAGAGYNYSWNTGQATQTITVSAAGIYTVTITNGNGCIASDSIAVSVNPLPPVSINGPATGLCQGQTVQLTASITNAFYIWSNGASTTSIYVNTAGIYTVTVTDVNGCTKSSSFNLVSHPLPTVTITGNPVFCSGSSSTLTAQATGIIVSYLWSDGSTNSSLTVTASGTYSVTVFTNYGCSATAGQTVIVNPAPAVNAISGPPAICFGQSATLSVLPGFSYLWSTAETTQSISVSTSGNYTVIVTNGTNCTVALNHTITVNPLPAPNITGTTSICQGTATILNAGAGYSNYGWSTNQTSQTINTGAAGLYTVTVTDANGCTASDNTYLTVNPLPTPVIVGNSTICSGEQANLTVGSVYAAYAWSTGAQSQAISSSLAGTYTVTVTDLNGCTATASFEVTVVNATIPVITSDGPLLQCEGNTITLTASPGTAYVWWPGGQTTQSISVTQTGIYFVSVLNTCWRLSQTVVAAFHRKPEARMEIETILKCGQGVWLAVRDNSLYAHNATYFWDIGNGAHFSEENNTGYLFEEPGSYPVTLYVTSEYNCVDTITKFATIAFEKFPEASFKTDPSVASIFNPTITCIDHSKYAVRWNWLMSDGFGSDVQNPSHYFNDYGNFDITLTVDNSQGCQSSHTESVFITPFHVPNAFTPNGDDKNDVFFNSGHVMDISSYHMVIYSRWGEKVFENDNYNRSWNGLDKNNNRCPEGVYIYTIKVINKRGREFVYQGTVALVR